MKKVTILLSCYCVFVGLLLLQKPIFLCYHWNQSAPEGFFNCLKTLWYGLPMDMSVAGYFTVIPGLLLLISVFVKSKYFIKILSIYFAVISFLISIIFFPDLLLYSYWGFRMDATVFTYIVQPKEAAAGVSVWIVIFMIFAVLFWTIFQYWILKIFVLKPCKQVAKKRQRNKITRKISEAAVFVLLFGLMFIAIRGGVTVSTMNVSRVYFSESMYLNHAAINPCFSMFSSIARTNKQTLQYQFMDKEEALQIVEQMLNRQNLSDSIPQLLNTSKPNIIFILLESFGAAVVEPLGGMPGVTPHLNRLSEEGIFFRKMYAGSFRTDRGLVCVLSAYPAQPTMSIIKYPAKSQTLKSIPSILKNEGYHVSFLYGGDLNFAYIKSYLVTQGIINITQDVDFHVSERLSKWGAPDHITFERLLSDVKRAKIPFLKVFLTLSSHEPFEVPFHKFEDPYLNSVAYTDSCLGQFIDSLKQLPEWDNTLVIMVPDHDMKYPPEIRYDAPERHDIFSLWIGGAVKQPEKIDNICSQTDIAATLLSQLKINYLELPFSNDVLNPATKEYAFYDFPNGFGIITPQGFVVYDCDAKKVSMEEGTNTDSLLLGGKAYLQYLYEDIGKR